MNDQDLKQMNQPDPHYLKITRVQIEAVREFLLDLKEEWDWKRIEKRCDCQKEFYLLEHLIKDLENLLDNPAPPK